MFSAKLEIRHFHIAVIQKGQRNVQKSVMHVQSCFFDIFVAIVLLDLKFPGVPCKTGESYFIWHRHDMAAHA